MFIEYLQKPLNDLKKEPKAQEIDRYYDLSKRELIDALLDLSEPQKTLLFAEEYRSEKTWSKAIYGIASDIDLNGRGGKSTPALIEAMLEEKEFISEKVKKVIGPSDQGSSDKTGSKNKSGEEDGHEKSDQRQVGGQGLTQEEQEIRRHELQRAFQAGARKAVEEERSQAVYEDRSENAPDNMFKVRPAFIGWEEGSNKPIAMIHLSDFAFSPKHK